MKIIQAEVALGGIDGGSGEEADHFIKEAISSEAEDESVIGVDKGGLGDGADVISLGGLISAKRGKGAEVVRATEDLKHFLKGLRIQKTRKMPSAPRIEWREDGQGAKSISVSLRSGVVARVKIRSDFLAGHDTDRVRELCVDRRHPVTRVHRKMRRRIKVGDLPERVDPSIGPARAMDAHLFTPGSLDRGFDEVLDGATLGLGLPTLKRRAVVGDGEFESHEKITSQGSR